jgi:hypothetical protein
MNAIWVHRKDVISSHETCEILVSQSQISQLSGRRMPAMSDRSEDFPAPLAPMRATQLPVSIFQSKFLKRDIISPCEVYDFAMP